jgi:hypothetical protein
MPKRLEKHRLAHRPGIWHFSSRNNAVNTMGNKTICASGPEGSALIAIIISRLRRC